MNINPNDPNSLRAKAEAQLMDQENRPAEELLYELQVHHIELEMQNEALRRSHADLEESRDNYLELYDFAPVGYLTLTHKGFIAQINLTATLLLGTHRNKLLNHRFAALVTPQLSDRWHLFFAGAIKCSGHKNIELVLIRRDGTEFYVQLDCVNIMSAEQEPMLRISLADISKIKQAEAALREAERQTIISAEREQTIELLRHSSEEIEGLYNHAPCGYHSFDMDGIIRRINNTELTWIGYTRDEVVGKLTVENFYSATDIGTFRKISPQLMQQGFINDLEIEIIRKNGTSFIGLVNTTALYDSNGDFVMGLSTIVDITERKRQELELRIAAIAFESQEGTIITDSNAVMVRVNQAFTRLTGYSAEEAIGQTPRLLSSGRHDPAFYQNMWAHLNGQGYWQGEIWNKRKNGEIYPEWLCITAVNTPDGCPTHYVGTFSDITSNKDATAKIHYLAYYDPLTTLPNRRLFQERLARALVICERSKNFGALLFIDLDNFKSLNDTLGHDMGDELLAQVATRLQACIRESDTVARLGGDEFVIILEELSQDLKEAAIQVKDIGEKILSTLNQNYFICKHEYHNTPSIGIALFNNNQESMENLLKRADIAMYAAKDAGRNTLRFFDPEMQNTVVKRASLEMDLACALAENQFKLYFQLQSTHDRQAIGAEVLLRWEHPKRGLVSPLEFIPLAEETKLILPIGLWVLDTACAQLKSWEGYPETRHLQLAVNVSAHQFHEDGFVSQVCAMLEKHAIQANRLKLELTESLVLNNIEDTIIKMHELKKIGVRFSMDDFGTGFSSLSYLTKLPLNQLKIDQSFVRNIGVKPTDAVIVQTIIGMANNLGMEVIAEGVETEGQRAFLEQHGCPAIQGYLFGKPVPIKQFERMLKQAL